MKLLKKKQLLKFLEIIQLKGLDPRGKENPTFNDCILSFEESGSVSVFGINKGNSIFFNHHFYINTEDPKTIKIAIPDIKLWIKYITDLPNETLEIKVTDGLVYLIADNDSYYEIPQTNETSIESAVIQSPVIAYDNNANLGITNIFEDEELDSDVWAQFVFNPEHLAIATDAGRNVETLTTSLTFREDGVDIEVGKLPSAGTGPKFVKKNVEGFNAEENGWLWTSDATKSWVGVFGLNPISRILLSLESESTNLYYQSEDKNLIIYDESISIEGSQAILVWMVSPLARHQGAFIDASVENGGEAE